MNSFCCQAAVLNTLSIRMAVLFLFFFTIHSARLCHPWHKRALCASRLHAVCGMAHAVLYELFLRSSSRTCYDIRSDDCTFFLFFLCDAKRKERRIPKKEKKKPLWGQAPTPPRIKQTLLVSSLSAYACRPWHGCDDAHERSEGMQTIA